MGDLEDTQPPVETSSPFLDAPAPWLCKGEAFWFFGYFSPPKGYYPPKSAFSDLEGSSSFANPEVTGTYKGGLTTIMVIRYKESPVGMTRSSFFKLVSSSSYHE